MGLCRALTLIVAISCLSLACAVKDGGQHLSRHSETNDTKIQERRKYSERRVISDTERRDSVTASERKDTSHSKGHNNGLEEYGITRKSAVHNVSETTAKPLEKQLNLRGENHQGQTRETERDKRQYFYREPPFHRQDTAAQRRRIVLFNGRNQNGPCSANFCHHNGRCIARLRRSFFCSCPFGYIGARCEVKTECKPDSCKNGGTCTEMGMGRHLCTCSVGYRGDNCEGFSRCHPNPCRNGGTCSETDENFTCLCPAGYKGKTCAEINKCSPNPCKNKGTCFELNDDFVCNCAKGFKGKICQVISECSTVYCLNGGTCRDEEDGYKCDCPYGFSGKRCEASACLPNPCRNDGACLKFGAKSSCQCKLGYFGRRCEESSACMRNICQNDGTCVDGSNTNSKTGFACLCQPSYDGIFCEKHLSMENVFQGKLGNGSN